MRQKSRQTRSQQAETALLDQRGPPTFPQDEGEHIKRGWGTCVPGRGTRKLPLFLWLTGARSVVSDTKAYRFRRWSELPGWRLSHSLRLRTIAWYSLDSTSSDPTYPNSGRVKRKRRTGHFRKGACYWQMEVISLNGVRILNPLWGKIGAGGYRPWRIQWPLGA